MTGSLKLLSAAVLLLSCISLPAADTSMQLDGMAVIGNSELPKALFIVPWKDPAAGPTPGRPLNSLVDNALQPVDPDVFRRKLDYFDSVHKTD